VQTDHSRTFFSAATFGSKQKGAAEKKSGKVPLESWWRRVVLSTLETLTAGVVGFAYCFLILCLAVPKQRLFL